MDRVSKVGAHTKFMDLDGQEHELKESGARRPSVIAFVRHFGCLLCPEQVVPLRREVDTFHVHGAEYRWQKLFRCPQGDEVATTRFGSALDPNICPSCSVPLKLFHGYSPTRGASALQRVRPVANVFAAVDGNAQAGDCKHANAARNTASAS